MCLSSPSSRLSACTSLPGCISHTVSGKPLLARFHELLGPCVGGVRLDSLPPAPVTHCNLPAKPLQHDADLLLGGVRAPGGCSDSLYETWPPLDVPQQPLPWLLLSGTHLLLSVGTPPSVLELTPPRSLSAFSPSSGVSFSLTTYILSGTSLAPLSEVLYLIRELTPPQISRVFLPPLLSHYR